MQYVYQIYNKELQTKAGWPFEACPLDRSALDINEQCSDLIATDISAFSTTMIFFISAAETITLDDAKEKVQTIIRRLDQRDITGFRNWVTSVISENVYSEGTCIIAFSIQSCRSCMLCSVAGTTTLDREWYYCCICIFY